MSIVYCHDCDQHIDLDFDSDHFIYEGDEIVGCTLDKQNIFEEDLQF